MRGVVATAPSPVFFESSEGKDSRNVKFHPSPPSCVADLPVKYGNFEFLACRLASGRRLSQRWATRRILPSWESADM